MFSANTTQVSSAANYIEDVFSTYLYTGNGSTQTITNGIDLSGKGGLAWIKFRNPSADGITGEHCLFDTARGATYRLRTNATNPQGAVSNSLTSFNSDGFTLGAFDQVNSGYLSRQTYASWTFRKQPKFFDVVTVSYTGSAVTVNHNLGSVPGCIIMKLTTGTDSTGALNLTNAFNSPNGFTNFASSITSTSFTFDAGFTSGTYVFYLFAHNAGGFGLTGTDNVISCGSYTGAATAPFVSLGYEPQWVLVKRTSSVADWRVYDAMRGMTVSTNTTLGPSQQLKPNTSDAETSTNYGIRPDATGFTDTNAVDVGGTYIYIAIRRGPMKTPTSGTNVYTPSTAAAGTNISVGFPSDLWIGNNRDATGGNNAHTFASRLTGTNWLQSATTAAEGTGGLFYWDLQNSFRNDQFGGSRVEYLLRRAPGFFDEVCWSGNDVNGRTLYHNLNAVPELIITKTRNGTYDWYCYSAALGNTGMIRLNVDNPGATGYSMWNSTTPTSTYFKVDNGTQINTSGFNYVAYLFASCPGVSKVGSYTGTGTTKQIDCGFTGGARFVLIKRTDSTGDWYVWDSARGIVAGNDPYLLLNSTAAEVTSTDYVDTYSAGFEISSTAPAAINANGGTYIFLAIA